MIDFEKLENSDAKCVLWSTLDMALEMRVEEHIYKLERDEAAMLSRLRDTNLHATGVDKFLNKNKDSAVTQNLDGYIDKKKVFESKRVIC